jgi:hypothetical protein
MLATRARWPCPLGWVCNKVQFAFPVSRSLTASCQNAIAGRQHRLNLADGQAREQEGQASQAGACCACGASAPGPAAASPCKGPAVHQEAPVQPVQRRQGRRDPLNQPRHTFSEGL